MRKLIVGLICIVAVCAYALTPKTNYDLAGKIDAYQQHHWEQLNAATTADTPLIANTKYYDLITPSNSIDTWLQIPNTWTLCEVSFYCYGDGTGVGDPNGGEFDFKIYAAKWYGSAKTVYEGYASCGELELSVFPATDRAASSAFTAGDQINSGSLDANQSYKWVDAIEPNGVGDAEWMSDVVVTTGTDDMGTITFRSRGYWLIWCEITNFPADVTSINALVTGYGD